MKYLYYKKEKSQINDFSFHLKKWEKDEQIKFKINRRKEIKKIRMEINETENSITKEKIN